MMTDIDMQTRIDQESAASTDTETPMDELEAETIQVDAAVATAMQAEPAAELEPPDQTAELEPIEVPEPVAALETAEEPEQVVGAEPVEETEVSERPEPMAALEQSDGVAWIDTAEAPAAPEPVAAVEQSDLAEPVDAVETGPDETTAVAVSSDEPAARPVEYPAIDDTPLTAALGQLASEASSEAAAEPTAPPAPVSDEERWAKLDERAAALVAEVETAPNQATFLGRVRRLIGQIPDDLHLEGVAPLKTRLAEVETAILAQIEERKMAKEAIVAKAEMLADANEWKATGEALRGLFEDWKAIGSAGHEVEDPLWKRFQTARDRFSQRRNEWFEGRQKEWAGNREKKEALCVRAEEMSESTEWRQTADAMRNLMTEWKTISSAGRESDDALWSRFRAAQQIFFDRRSTTFDENKTRKEELCAQAEAHRDSSDWRQTAEEMKALQVAWKGVGPVGNRDAEDALWQRFRAATQAFFDRRGETFADRDRDESDNLRRKEELCAAAESLAVAADQVAATEEAKALQAEWKTIGPVRRDRGDQLWARFRAACDRVFENSTNERARRQVEWSTKMRDAMLRKEEQLARLEESITFDEMTVSRWQASLEGRPDPALQAKVAHTTARIEEKRARATELKTSVHDILAKMGS